MNIVGWFNLSHARSLNAPPSDFMENFADDIALSGQSRATDEQHLQFRATSRQNRSSQNNLTSSDIFELCRFLWTHVFRKLKAVVRCTSCHSSSHRYLICWGNPRCQSRLALRQTTASTSNSCLLRLIQTFPPSPSHCRRYIQIWVKCLQQDSGIFTLRGKISISKINMR